MTNKAKQYRENARECLKLANAVPARDRQALPEMATEWEWFAAQQDRATDLPRGNPE
jgi:hypothetical protein